MSDQVPFSVMPDYEKSLGALSNLQALVEVFAHTADSLPDGAPVREPLFNALMEMSDLVSLGRIAVLQSTEDDDGAKMQQYIDRFLDALQSFDFNKLMGSIGNLPLSQLAALNDQWRDLIYALQDEIKEASDVPREAEQEPENDRKKRMAVILEASEPKLTKEEMRRMPFNLVLPIYEHLRANFQVRGALTSSHLNCLVHAHLLLGGILEAVMPPESLDVQVRYVDEIVRHHNMARHFNRMHESQYGGAIFDERKLKTPDLHAKSSQSGQPGQELVAR